MRACLNTLQFLARRQRRITAADIHRLQVGQKDVSKGAFAIWQELLVSKVGCKPVEKNAAALASAQCSKAPLKFAQPLCAL